MKRDFEKALKINDRVYWVGAIDWNAYDIHGYTAERGTTYNAYLIVGEKITLVDTVKGCFESEMMSRIASVVAPEKIDYIISNHAEMDHSACLQSVIERVKPEAVFASALGVQALKEHFEFDIELTPVKTGDEILLGDKTVAFYETKMLHWPDSMFTYLKDDRILFTQDVFGMHLATSKIFADENPDYAVVYETKQYFANIMMPMSGQVLKMLEQLGDVLEDVDVLATDHGPIWRGNTAGVVEYYRDWAQQKKTDKALIVYDTMWGSTEKMARVIADGIESVGAECKLMSTSVNHRSAIATEVVGVGALLVGSPTLNGGVYPPVADFLTYIRGLSPKNKFAVAFGSYGWNGKAVVEVNRYFSEMGLEVISDGQLAKYVPDGNDLQKCFELGKMVGLKLTEK